MHNNIVKVKVEFEIWKTHFEINYPVPSLGFWVRNKQKNPDICMELAFILFLGRIVYPHHKRKENLENLM